MERIVKIKTKKKVMSPEQKFEKILNSIGTQEGKKEWLCNNNYDFSFIGVSYNQLSLSSYAIDLSIFDSTTKINLEFFFHAVTKNKKVIFEGKENSLHKADKIIEYCSEAIKIMEEFNNKKKVPKPHAKQDFLNINNNLIEVRPAMIGIQVEEQFEDDTINMEINISDCSRVLTFYINNKDYHFLKTIVKYANEIKQRMISAYELVEMFNNKKIKFSAK